MGPKLYHVIFWLASMVPQALFQYTPNSSEDQEDLLPRIKPRGWKLGTTKDEPGSRCKEIKPTPRDVLKRIYAILPYFDRDLENAAFLQRYRITINKLSESMDLVDRQVAFYAAVLTPILFLQRYRDAKCLIERFEQTLREFHAYPPSEKRNALKNLKDLRDISRKIREFVSSLPDKRPPTRTPALELLDDEDDMKDKKDIRFLKELIKNLG